MIFVCGAISLLVGFLIMYLFGNRYSSDPNTGEYIGAIFLYGGIAAMLYSLATVLWRVMP